MSRCHKLPSTRDGLKRGTATAGAPRGQGGFHLCIQTLHGGLVCCAMGGLLGTLRSCFWMLRRLLQVLFLRLRFLRVLRRFLQDLFLLLRFLLVFRLPRLRCQGRSLLPDPAPDPASYLTWGFGRLVSGFNFDTTTWAGTFYLVFPLARVPFSTSLASTSSTSW